ncbi:MAG: hypothetical protein ACLFUL_06285 [Desulfobacteraceae bacterium]
MDGTLKGIVYKVRELINSDLSDGLSQGDIVKAVNRFYRQDFPRIAHVQDLTWWYTLTLSEGSGDYGIEDGIFAVQQPVLIQETEEDRWHKLWVTTDKELFWANYEFDEDESEPARPEALLIFQRTLYLRPTPDDAYPLRLPCKGKPQALSELEDTPERSHWVECIAYGAAHKILMDNNRLQEYQNVQSGLDQQISLIASEYVLQQSERRAIRGF